MTKIIQNFTLNLSNLASKGEVRKFSVSGDRGSEFILPITNEDGSMGPPNLMGEESPMRKPPNNPDPDPDPEQEPQDTGSGNTIPPDPTQQPGSGRP